MTHRPIAGHQQVGHLIVEVLDAVVDHDVGVPHLTRGQVDGGDVLVVGGDPLQPGVEPPHDEPDVGLERARLGVHIQVERDDVESQGDSSTTTLQYKDDISGSTQTISVWKIKIIPCRSAFPRVESRDCSPSGCP